MKIHLTITMRPWRIPFLVFAATFNLALLVFYADFQQRFRMASSAFSSCLVDLLDLSVLTAVGYVSHQELLDAVFQPLNYELRTSRCVDNAPEMFPLQRINIQCEAAFDEWLSIQKHWAAIYSGKAPPKHLSTKDQALFTLNGTAVLSYVYLNNIPTTLPKEMLEPWTQLSIDKYLKKFKQRKFVFLPYGSECVAVFHALQRYSPASQTGMVIGSQSPWVEAMLLHHGVKQIYTVEYAPLTIAHPTIAYVHPSTLATNWNKYTTMDFVVSFSSIEHSGLGRYGDPLDPIGDLREVDKMRCLLKTGGLLFIGLPVGQDEVVFNAHRIYGAIRWPMIAAGFEFLGAFNGVHPNLQMQIPVSNITGIKHYLAVLRKL